MRELQGVDESSDSRIWVTDERPENTLSFEWLYELDLDNLIFHIDRFPMFPLITSLRVTCSLRLLDSTITAIAR